MVNVNMLKGAIVSHGYDISSIAKAIGMNRATMYRKLKEPDNSFSICEADRIVKVLNLTASEATSIFFSQFVA